ncbi:MAG: replicative DNA helicase [Peptoniphilaceae bacterium]|nr:replicative DNA helicase [Peptoniphilaceae bacterium]MDY6085760.1 replicative DNA helicase [Peptoniphilaceae bacterium]
MDQALPKLPANARAERSVLGSVLLDESLLIRTMEALSSEDFYYPKNRILYEAMLKLNRDHEPIDVQMLMATLEQENQLDAVGGIDGILDITREVFYPQNIDAYIEIMKNHTLQRALIRFGEDVSRRAQTGEDRSAVVLEAAEEKLLALTQERTNVGLTPINDTLEETLDAISTLAMTQGTITGIPTGFRWLDELLSGLHRSDLVLLAARPSMGKTALGLNIGFNAARYRDKEGKHPYRVAIFSLEMSKNQLVQRLIAMASGVNLQRIISGDFKEDEDWAQLIQGVTVLQELPIFIDDTSGISVQELRSKCRRLQIQEGLDLVVIDYLQLMSADSGGRNENRQQEITQISRGLKGLAKELNCPVLALSQLSRKAESREGARPMMSDMRESGAIEQDADVVMLLYREDYYNEETEHPNVTEVNVAKHRNGPIGKVNLYFEKELTRFKDLSSGVDPTV